MEMESKRTSCITEETKSAASEVERNRARLGDLMGQFRNQLGWKEGDGRLGNQRFTYVQKRNENTQGENVLRRRGRKSKLVQIGSKKVQTLFTQEIHDHAQKKVQ